MAGHNTLWTLCFGLTIAFSSPVAHADLEVGQPIIRNFEPSEYGSNTQVWSIVQDRRGMMYFGTGSSLLEYDGIRWRQVALPKVTEIRVFARDAQGTILVGGSSEFGFLSVGLDGETQYHSLMTEVDEKYRSLRVYHVLATSHGAYFTTKKVMFRWFDGQVSVLPIGGSFPMALDDRVYVHTPQGIAEIRDGNVDYLDQSALPFETYGRIWMVPIRVAGKIRVYSQKRGFLDYLKDASSVSQGGTRFAPLPSEATAYLIHNGAYDFTALDRGRLAVGTTTGGVVILDRHNRLVQVINEHRGLLNNDILDLYVDRFGDLWAGVQGGISHIHLSSPFTLFGKKSALSPAVDAVVRHRGHIYAGRFSDGPRMLPPYQLTLDQDAHDFVTLEGERRQYAWDFISVGRYLLVASRLARVIDGLRIADIPNSPTGYEFCRSKRFPDAVFLGIAEPSGGGLGLITFGATDVDVGSDEPALEFKYEGKLDGIEGVVKGVAADTEGHLWLSTHLAGIIHLRFNSDDVRDYELTRYTIEDGLPLLEQNRVRFDGDQMLVTTRKGVYTAIQSDDGSSSRIRFVPHAEVNAVLTHPDDPVSNLVRLEPNRYMMNTRGRTGILYRNDDGGYRYEYRAFNPVNLGTGGIARDDDGVLWMATDDGLHRFDPSIEKTYDVAYGAVIRLVKTNLGREIFKGNHIDEISESEGHYLRASFVQSRAAIPTLAYAENGFVFEYASLFYEHSADTEFQFRLEGFDADWSEWTRDTKKEYTNIPEGKYAFKVRAKNIYDCVSAEAVYRFVIRPPWYRSWPIYIVYGVLFLLVLNIGIRMNTRRLRAAKRRLEGVVAERTAEIVEQKNEIEFQKEELEAAHSALWGEMALAKKIQTVLLPTEPQIPGFEVTGFMQTADEVGGDYYDVIERSGRYWLLIGDVSGHGVPAGLVMMMVQTAMNQALEHLPDGAPSDVLTYVNRTIYDNVRKLGESKYMTLTLMAFHPTGEIHFAGLHQDLLIFRHAHQSVERVATEGIWLGVTPDISGLNAVKTVKIEPQDVILLHTDGIVEARNGQGDMYGGARLAKTFERCGNRSPDEIRDGIIQSLDGHTWDDDLTLMIVKRI